MSISENLYPIVYVRGYAGTQGEVEDTVADPYMGFNIGSTKLRQTWDGSIAKHIFESPLVRLMKDYGYTDAYRDGSEINDSPIGLKSVWIYRYYEPVSNDLGSGERPEMETYAQGLGEYLNTIRNVICGNNQRKRAKFKVYLVAHSMGGLVVRCWLQNLRLKENNPVEVEKVFTYATPHAGIDLRGIGNVPSWFKVNNAENFNQKTMRRYLKLKKKDPVNSLNGTFPEERFFSLIGTNCKDYTAVAGLSKRAVGSFSDGLVKIKNAYVQGTPRAFVHRAHSGHYGIVNSEEGYQNLKRFFFGDVRVAGNLHVHQVTLPKKIAQAEKKGKTVRAAYHVEVVTKVRDARWDLYRRTVNDASAIYIEHEKMNSGHADVALFSSYLSKEGISQTRKNRNNQTEMGFAVNLSVSAPEYVVDNTFFFDDYYEGDYIFNDQLKLKVKLEQGRCVLRYRWSSAPDTTWHNIVHVGSLENEWLIEIPCNKGGEPGLEATLTLIVSAHDN